MDVLGFESAWQKVLRLIFIDTHIGAFHIVLLLLSFHQVYGIRMDPVIQLKHTCRATVQGRFFLTDDNGRVCNSFRVDALTRCCPEKGERFSCQGCNLSSSCCNSYEFCVSCCLNPAMTSEKLALRTNMAKHATSGTYKTLFDFCAGRCLHNSESVVHENAYVSEYHHCFSMPSNFSATSSSSTHLDAKLAGISIIVGRQGDSCSTVCKANGQSCVPNKLALLNRCEVIQKHMSCKGGCWSSMGRDQPAEVVENAPGHLKPGACVFTNAESSLSCDGWHAHTKRLCPCA